ncbi:MAG: hypothetical protein ABIP51_11680 [Bacteroidia bacterium]
MKYFAKYLPVEGEIKDGGKYWNKQHNEADDVIGEIHVSILKNGNFKPAKLSLCSRNIQIGDENLKGESEISKVHNQEHLDSINLANKFVLDSFYKVVGKISPDATWVKEGDEFNEEDILKFVYDDSGVDQPWCIFLNQDWDEIDNKFKMIKIKCSQCNTYH